MKAKIVRTKIGVTSTLGELQIDGVKVCLILEDQDRDLNMDGDHEDTGEGKVLKRTCIPYTVPGKHEYKIVLEPHGSIHESYLKKNWAKLGFPGFEEVYRGMLMVTGINGFSRVHIHIGNNIEHTEGCPLTGTNANTSKDPFTVSASTQAYVKLYKKVINYLEENGHIDLEVVKA